MHINGDFPGRLLSRGRVTVIGFRHTPCSHQRPIFYPAGNSESSARPLCFCVGQVSCPFRQDHCLYTLDRRFHVAYRMFAQRLHCARLLFYFIFLKRSRMFVFCAGVMTHAHCHSWQGFLSAERYKVPPQTLSLVSHTIYHAWPPYFARPFPASPCHNTSPPSSTWRGR